MPTGLGKVALFLVYWFMCSAPVALVLTLVCVIASGPYLLLALLSLPVVIAAGVYLWRRC
jgi:hypothetical protein